MSDLIVDFDELIRAAGHVDSVTLQFSRAHGDAATAATWVGHGGLSRKVQAFASEWDVGRSHLNDSLERLAAKYRAVAETLRELDSQTANQLREAAAKSRAEALARQASAPARMAQDAAVGVAYGNGTV